MYKVESKIIAIAFDQQSDDPQDLSDIKCKTPR